MNEKALSPGYYIGTFDPNPIDKSPQDIDKFPMAIAIETSSGSVFSGRVCLGTGRFASIRSLKGTVDGEEFCARYSRWEGSFSLSGRITKSSSDSSDETKTSIDGKVNVAPFPWIKPIWKWTGAGFLYRQVLITYAKIIFKFESKFFSLFGVKLKRGSALINETMGSNLGDFVLGEAKFVKEGKFEVKERVLKQTPIELDETKYRLRNVKTGERDGPYSLKHFVNHFADKVWIEDEGWEVTACGTKWLPIDAILKGFMEEFDCEKFWLPPKEKKMARECLLLITGEILSKGWAAL